MRSSWWQLERTLPVFAALIVVGCLAAVTEPFTHSGLPTGHDATAHITYTFLFDRALSQGQLPVRWVEWVRHGESQPLFNFYPPGLYYLIAIVHAVGVPLSIAYKTVVVVLLWMGAALMWAWLRRPFGGIAAAAGAALFVLSPYVIVDVFVRAAYPEVAAIMIAPGLFWAIDRLIVAGRGRDVVLVAAFTAAMLLTHLLSSLIFGPVAALYAAARLWRTERATQRLLQLGAGATLGVGLAAFFVVPSMVEMKHIAISRMTSGYSDYQQHFVAPAQWIARSWGYGGSVAGSSDAIPLQVAAVQWAALGMACVAVARWLVTRRSIGDGTSISVTFWLAASGTALWLMTAAAAPLWQAIPALAYLQFPWRYFMVVSLGTAVLSAAVLGLVRSRALQVVLLVVVVAGHYVAYRTHLRPAEYMPHRTMDIDNARWPEIERATGGAFLERGFTPVAAARVAPGGASWWTVMDGSAEIRPITLADAHIVLDIRSGNGVRLRLNTHAFPGWIILVNGEPTTAAVDPRYGYLEVTLAAGTHRVEARFTNTPIRTMSNVVSLASLAICVVLVRTPRRVHLL